jgi:hypothetical protein
MSLVVEVAGYGICRSETPYAVLVICVQQENFQAWAVYRRFSHFLTLSEQLSSLYQTIPVLEDMSQLELSHEILEEMRVEANKWLQVAGK